MSAETQLERWIGEPLRGPHHSDASFIRRSHQGVTCLLCGTGEMNYLQLVESHLRGGRHQRNYTKLEALQEQEYLESLPRYVRITKAVSDGVQSLGLPRWRHEVQALVLEYIQTVDLTTRNNVFDKATRLLFKYIKMEQLSLLELAVWKASILSDNLFYTMEDLDAYWALDADFDPAAYANERRVTSGIQVIIQGVLPFLG